MSDAHAVYDYPYADGRSVEVGCGGHRRRYFFKGLSSHPEQVREALALIGRLFEIEGEAASVPARKRQQAHWQKSWPVTEAFFSWCESKRDDVLDQTPIWERIRYALNQRKAFERFLADGRLLLHDDGSELQLRRQAVGRKS